MLRLRRKHDSLAGTALGFLLPLTLMCALSCAATSSLQPTAATTPQPLRLTYTVTPDANLTNLRQVICFEGRSPKHLKAQMPGAERALVSATGPAGALPVKGNRVGLEALPDNSCVTLRIDLTAALHVARYQSHSAARSAKWLNLSPDFWLWSPGLTPQDIDAELIFELPDEVQVAVPWRRHPEQAHRYTLPYSAFRLANAAVFGRFEAQERSVGGATVNIVCLEERFAIGCDGVADWVQASAEAVTTLYKGKFPVGRATVFVQGRPGTRVGFGSAKRGGGSSVAVNIGRDASLEQLLADWTLVHELSHLGIPYLPSEDSWLDEGLATYLEPIMRARAGQLSRRRAWERLADGFRRGASSGTGRPLSEESRLMHRTYAYWRVYWGGAAIAFLADVSSRKDGGGGLEAEIQEIEAKCISSERPWTATELMFCSGTAVPKGQTSLQTIALRWLPQATFPAVADALGDLGLRFDERGRLLTKPGDPGAALRIAIMGGDVEPTDALYLPPEDRIRIW